MELSPHHPVSRVVPTLVACAVSAAMVWLAGDPFALIPAGAIPIGTVRILFPGPEVSGFPTVFRWQPVPGNPEYEITVWPDSTPQAPLFRQRGSTEFLDVEIEPGHEPGPGRYGLEIIAWKAQVPLARGLRHFVVEEGT